MSTFLHHLRYAFRNIFRSKIYSLFNIFGFALGFTICIIAGLYIYREFSVDKSFKDYQDIYRIVDDENNLSQLDYDLAEKLEDRFPEIESITPAFISIYELIVREPQKENYITTQHTISTEKDFFSIFELDFLAGSPPDSIKSEPWIIITKSIAERLFGQVDVVGKQILAGGGTFAIKAVVQDMPENSSFKADLFLDSSTGIRLQQARKNDDWYSSYQIYALLKGGTNPQFLEEKINNDLPENKSETKKIRLQPLTDIYFDKMITDSNNYSGNRSLIFIFMTIAIVILILSVINYVNFTLSRQLDTLKQLGVKKVYGASFRQLRSYYIVEIGLSVFFSFLLSLIIGAYMIPVFETVLDTYLNIKHILTPVFILSILSVLAIVVLISSLTPFYIVSKYDVQMLFGKKQSYFGKQRGKMILTGCQMGITVVMFVCLFILQKQLDYMKRYDLGFDKNHLVRIVVPNSMSEVFRNEIAQYDFVKSSVSSYHAPGFMGASGLQRNEQNDKDILIHQILTDIDFINTFNLQLLQGRDFTDADRENSCIINEEAMEQLGWNNIEGKMCNDMKVIGVVKDFNISSLHNRTEPVNIIPLKKENFAYGIVSLNFKGDTQDALAQLQIVWERMFPGEPFDYRFYNEVFDTYYKKEERQSTAIAIISFVAIIITCMGLIGQVKQTSLSKAKEIGIRKINGATIVEMMLVIPKNFLKSFAVAFVFSIPIAWIAMDKWLENFAFKTDISWWIFALSGVVVFMILTSFILWQTWKAASANPVDIIKTE